MKAGDQPKAKPVWKDKPREAGAERPKSSEKPPAKFAAKSGAKAVWKKPAKDAGPAREAKPEGGYNRAADASKRFVPPGKGKKPAAPRGAKPAKK
jgi:ATP-dependent RNA helicase DeaD